MTEHSIVISQMKLRTQIIHDGTDVQTDVSRTNFRKLRYIPKCLSIRPAGIICRAVSKTGRKKISYEINQQKST